MFFIARNFIALTAGIILSQCSHAQSSALLKEILQEESALGQVSQGRCLADESFEPLENSKHRLHLLTANIGYQQSDTCQQIDATWLALYKRNGENYERLFGSKFNFTDNFTVSYIPYEQHEQALPIFYYKFVYSERNVQGAYVMKDDRFMAIDESEVLAWAEGELTDGQSLDAKRARVRYSEDLLFYQSRVFNPGDKKRATGGEIYAELILALQDNVARLVPQVSSDREQARQFEQQGEQALVEGNLAQAQADFTEAIVAHSKEWDAWLGLAKAALKSGDYAKAIAACDDILSAETSVDDKSEAFYIKGFAYELDGKVLAAQSAYREAVKLKDHQKAKMGLERLQ